MADSYFTQLRSYFHTFSRSFTMKGQDFVDQAPLKAGHNITTDAVRADEIPYFTYDMNVPGDYDVKIQQLVTGEVGSRVIKEDYASILKFYDGVELTVKENTNGETYQLIDPDTQTVVMGFVDPTDKFDETGEHTADIYQMSLLDEAGNKIPAANGQTWTFDTFNGTVQFANGETPASHPAWGKIKIRAFAYVGKKLNNVISEINQKIEESIGGAVSSSIAIKPFVFKIGSMTKEGNNYKITIPGFVLTTVNSDGLMIGEWSANDDGSSVVTFEEISDDLANSWNDMNFTSYAFVNKDGSKITILNSENINE